MQYDDGDDDELLLLLLLLLLLMSLPFGFYSGSLFMQYVTMELNDDDEFLDPLIDSCQLHSIRSQFIHCFLFASNLHRMAWHGMAWHRMA